MNPADLDRLERVRRLAAVPARERTEAWIRDFEGAFWSAPLVMFEPKAIEYEGHGFLRVSARSWREGSDFARPAALVDRLIDEGRGLILTDEGDMSQVWMSLGEVLSYRLYGRAFDRPNPTVKGGGLIIPAGETILVSLTGTNLPETARMNLRRCLQRMLEVPAPRACWVRLPSGQQALALDLCSLPPDGDATRRVFDAIRWLLPLRIAYIRVDDLATHEAMQPF